MIRRSLILLLPALGCARSIADLQTAPVGAGETKYYAAPLDSVVEAVRAAVPEVGLRPRSDSATDSIARVFLVAAPWAPFQGPGDLVRIIVQAAPEGLVAVRVHAMAKSTADDPRKEWADPVFNRLDARLRGAGPGPASQTAELARATLSGITPGRRVRVVGADLGRHGGPVFGVWQGGLVLGMRERQDTLPIARIDSVWVGRTYQRTGFLVGGIVGAIARVIASRCTVRYPSGESNCGEASAKGTAVFFGSLVAGGLIGSAIRRWTLRYP